MDSNPLHPPITIWTEGKTDWKHLKRAAQVLGIPVPLEFMEFDEALGGDALLRKCENHAEYHHTNPMIFIFDRDVPSIINQVNESNSSYKSWGNNIFSFAIPIPEHRRGIDDVCIELYYTDDELHIMDKNSRRIYLSTEFNLISGKLKSNPLVSVGNKHKLNKKLSIVDQEVYNEYDQNIALSKSDFANNIYTESEPFDKITFQTFLPIFEVVEKIAKETKSEIDLFFDGKELYAQKLLSLENSIQQLKSIYQEIIKLCKMSCLIFVAATVRYYEEIIIQDLNEYRKRIKPIRQIISEYFREPSLVTIHKIARACYYLTDDEAPIELQKIKSCFGEQIALDNIGRMLDDLDELFPELARRVKITNKPQIKKQLISFIIPEIARYETKVADINNLDLPPENILTSNSLLIWQDALEQLRQNFSVLYELVYVTRRIERTDASSDVFIVSINKYDKGHIVYSEEAIKLEDLRADQFETCEILINNEYGAIVSLDLFPFIAIRQSKIHHYKRTRANGYELLSMFSNRGIMIETRRKFNHFVFKSSIANGDQAIFWTDVLPKVSEENGIKANIPPDNISDFVGRKKQILYIVENIVQIPNTNGIIYGPGGVGKTALMIQLTRNLFKDSEEKNVLYENIIWVSSKKDYYNPRNDIIETKSQ